MMYHRFSKAVALVASVAWVVVRVVPARPVMNRREAVPSRITVRRSIPPRLKNSTIVITTRTIIIPAPALLRNGRNPVVYSCTFGIERWMGIINSARTISPRWLYPSYSCHWRYNACYHCTLHIDDGSMPPLPICIGPALYHRTIYYIPPPQQHWKNNNNCNCHDPYSSLPHNPRKRPSWRIRITVTITRTPTHDSNHHPRMHHHSRYVSHHWRTKNHPPSFNS